MLLTAAVVAGLAATGWLEVGAAAPARAADAVACLSDGTAARPTLHSCSAPVPGRTGEVSPRTEQVNAVTAGPATAVGWFDGMYPVPGGYRATGWAIDPARPGGEAVMDIKGYFIDYSSPYSSPPPPPVPRPRRGPRGGAPA